MMFSTMRLLLALVGYAACNVDASVLTTLVAARSHSNLSPEEFRELMEGHPGRKLQNSEACAFCAVSSSVPVSGCAGLGQNKDGKFCDFGTGEEFCCESNQSDCCELSPGGIAVVTIVPIVVLILIVLASCACCKCCPLHDKLCCANRNRTQKSEQESDPSPA